MSEYVVGQTVLWIAPYDNREPREVTVKKVGRVRVTISHGFGREEQYRMDTGYGVADFMGRIVTRERYADEQAQAAVMTALRQEFGVTFVGALSRGIPTAAWAQVLAVLQEARP